MAAPCINDTCSIATSIDAVTRHLNIDVKRASARGLFCSSGLGVKLYGDPAAAAPLDVCFQQLGVSDIAGDADGLGATAGLYSIPKRARFKQEYGTVVNIPQGAGPSGEGSESSDALGAPTITNPYACQATMLLIGRFEVGYTVSTTAADDYGNPTIDAGAMIPFNGDIRARLKVDGTPVVASYMDVGGVVPSALNNSNKRRWEYFAVRHSLAAGATVTLTATANHEGDNEVVNISTVNADVSFPDRGFNCLVEAIILPFNNETL